MVRVISFDPAQRRRHKWRNILHSVVLLALMFGLLGLCAWMFAGWVGVVWGGAVGAVLLMVARHASPKLILSLYAAREIPIAVFAEAHDILGRLSARAGLPKPPRLYYVPSATPTAFSVGGPRAPHIAVSDGMLRLFDAREFTGVMAHEISHLRNRDVTVMMLADIVGRVTYAFGFVGLFLLLVSVSLWVGTDLSFPWVPGLVLFFSPTVSNLLQLGLSRAREYNADLDAVALTGDPAGLASALEKLDRRGDGLWERIVFGQWGGDAIPSLLRTHPPTRERIRRLMSLYRTETFEPMSIGPYAVPGAYRRDHAPPRRRASGLWW